MKTEVQMQVQAYLDNELAPAEARKIASLISSDTEAQALYRELKETKEIVRGNEPVLQVKDSRDFYWSQIRREIESSEKAEAPRESRTWFVRWVAPLAGACALIALALTVLNVKQGPVVTEAPKSAPEAAVPVIAEPVSMRHVESSEMSTITFRSESEGMTVVWISNDI